MKQTIKQTVYLLALVATVIALIYVMQLRQRSSNSNLQPPDTKSSPQNCAPTPQPPMVSGSNTPTPDLDQFGTELAPASSVTPLPISKVTDLAKRLTDEDKVYVYVMRCEGTFELFLVGPNTILTQTIPLKPGDVILDSIPSSSSRHPPPRATVTPTRNRKPPRTGQPYPPPGTPYP
jgi:hypothetical protein